MKVRDDLVLVKELLIRKKKLETELSQVEKVLKEIVERLEPANYGDFSVVQASRLSLDLSRLKKENPDIYYKYLKEIQYKYARLNPAKLNSTKKEVENES